jgi:hypothetical protein
LVWCSIGLLDCDGPQGESGSGATDATGGSDIDEAVDLIASESLKVVKLAQVYSLLDEQVLMDWDNGSGLRGVATHFHAAGIGAHQHRAFLLDEPPGAFQC